MMALKNWQGLKKLSLSKWRLVKWDYTIEHELSKGVNWRPHISRDRWVTSHSNATYCEAT